MCACERLVGRCKYGNLILPDDTHYNQYGQGGRRAAEEAEAEILVPENTEEYDEECVRILAMSGCVFSCRCARAEIV